MKKPDKNCEFCGGSGIVFLPTTQMYSEERGTHISDGDEERCACVSVLRPPEEVYSSEN